MAFQDPGAVRWAHKLEYTTTLLQLISNVQNCSRNEAKLLFNKTSRTNALRMDTLAVITDLLFDASAAGDEQVARDHKLMESLNRRLNVLGTEYTEDIRYLNGLSGYKPASRKLEFLQNLRVTKPYFNSLRAILIDHPAYPVWNEQELMNDVRAEVQAEAQALLDGEDEEPDEHGNIYGDSDHDDEDDEENEDNEDEDGMQGIEMALPQHHLHPQPLPQPQPQPQQQNQYIPEDTSLCPKCSVPLPLDPESSTSHIKKCFEGDVSTEQTLSCCICEVVFTAIHEGTGTEEEKEVKRREHVDNCFKEGLKGFGSTSGGEGVKKGRWVDYICEDGNVPKDSECSICFEPFVAGDLLTRLLDCACIFHQAGLKKWYKSKLSSSRNPHGGMEVDERKVEEMEGRCPLHSH